MLIGWVRWGAPWSEETDMKAKYFGAISSLIGGEMIVIVGHEGRLSGLPERTILYLLLPSEPRTLNMLGKHSAAELQPQPSSHF